MKAAVDLKNFINEYKNDLSECGNLLAPEIRNGLVLYINSNITSTKPKETANKVATRINALCTSSNRLLQTIKNVK